MVEEGGTALSRLQVRPSSLDATRRRHSAVWSLATGGWIGLAGVADLIFGSWSHRRRHLAERPRSATTRPRADGRAGTAGRGRADRLPDPAEVPIDSTRSASLAMTPTLVSRPRETDRCPGRRFRLRMDSNDRAVEKDLRPVGATRINRGTMQRRPDAETGLADGGASRPALKG